MKKQVSKSNTNQDLVFQRREELLNGKVEPLFAEESLKRIRQKLLSKKK